MDKNKIVFAFFVSLFLISIFSLFNSILNAQAQNIPICIAPGGFPSYVNYWRLSGNNLSPSSTSWNVGIGTTNPQAKLEVAGDIISKVNTRHAALGALTYDPTQRAFTTQQWVSGSNYAYLQEGIFGPNATSSSLFGLGGDAKWAYIRLSSNNSANTAGLVIGTQINAPLVFGTYNVERMRITSAGNVGIGTTTPQAKLEVVGETKSSSGFYLNKKTITLTTAPKWLRFAQSVSNGGNNAGIFEIRWSRGGVHGHIIFNVGANYNNANGINLNLLGGSSYGSQGITQIRLLRNTTYDTMYLEFYAAYGETTSPMTIEVRQLSGYGWNLIDIVDGSIPTGYTAHTLSVSNAFAVNEDSKTFTVTKSGNVGIGTTTPQAKLEVVGAIRLAPSSQPSNPVEGMMYYDSSEGKFKCRTRSGWQDCGAGVATVTSELTVPVKIWDSNKTRLVLEITEE